MAPIRQAALWRIGGTTVIATLIYRRESRRALALIVVVYVLAALGTLTFALAFRSRVGLCQMQLVMDQVQQDEMALAACAQASRVLALDDPTVDSWADAWSGWHALEIPPSPGGDNQAAWQVWWRLVDETAKINVNLVPADVCAKIEGLDEAAVASILDWIDKDNVPNPDGAEKEYYASLSPASVCRNGPLETLEELALIKGITPQIYFGAGGQEQRNVNDPTSEQAQTAEDGKGTIGLDELLTVYGDGKLNLNTVPLRVLQAIPFLSDAARDEILSRQQSRAKKFTTLEDIRSNPAFTLADKIVLVQVARFNSSHFQLHVRIRPQGMPSRYEYAAILERDTKAVRVLRWQRKLPYGPRDDLPEAAHPGGSGASTD